MYMYVYLSYNICNRRSWFNSCSVIFFFLFCNTGSAFNMLYYTCTCLYSIYFHLFCPSSIYIIILSRLFPKCKYGQKCCFIHPLCKFDGRLVQNYSSTFSFHHNISHFTLLFLICTLSYPQCTFYMYI